MDKRIEYLIISCTSIVLSTMFMLEKENIIALIWFFFFLLYFIKFIEQK